MSVFLNEGNQRTDETFLNIVEDSLFYDMSHKNAGKCLIFDHEHFVDSKNNPQRRGTKVDVNKIESFFGQKLGFDVNTYHDLTTKEIFEKTQNMANEDLSKYNCFVCCILTHGTETQLNSHDGKYQLDQIISFFRAERCPSLAGKPKLFLIQACMGDQTDPGHEIRLLQNRSSLSSLGGTVSGQTSTNELTNVDTNLGEPIVTVRIPICADILVAYSTVPKFYSFRHPTQGSWFFEVLMETLEQDHEEHDLVTILTITKRKIAFGKKSYNTDQNFNDKKQIPWITDTLTRKVLFKKFVAQNQSEQ